MMYVRAVIKAKLLATLSILFFHSTFSTNTFSFVIHGDWGWIGENQTAVADAMGREADLIDAQFVIALGDNFYVDGVDNVTDPLWDSAFHDVYSHQSLQVPWYPILGNHDYHASVQAQIDRTYEAGENMWTFPSNYYVTKHSLDDGAILTIVYIDTQILEPDQPDTQIIFESDNWEQQRENHLAWIDATLEKEKRESTWLLVAGHYPIYSVGVNCDNEILASILRPILQKHKIHMYLAGHDHMHQYALMPDDGIAYVISGQSGGRGPFGEEGVRFMGISNATVALTEKGSYFAECGFATIEVTKDFLKTTFVNVKGERLYSHSLTNPYQHDIIEWITDLSHEIEDSSNIVHGMLMVLPLLVIGGVFYIFVVSRFKVNSINGNGQDSKYMYTLDYSTRSDAGLLDTSTRSTRSTGSRNGKLSEISLK